jgi:CheY-like chemotaxis protein
MEGRNPRARESRGRPRRSGWTIPVGIALLLAGYHLWDLRLRPTGTGLSVRRVSPEEVERLMAKDPNAIILDTRLHGRDTLAGRTLRIPQAELDRRLGKLEPYRESPVFVLSTSEPKAAQVAALLAREAFEKVAYIRIPETPSAQARAGGETAPLD